ncbi:MAG: TIR domain-containing protein [Deltaproteobacteria bacterium]|nr:TIR domain-containing protein [Deltaproteobacteria bacterium]
MASDDDYKYWAFISYSHQDSQWGDWLHKAIETYRVPKRLVGRPSRNGPIPARLFPVFRDRDELPGSSSLGSKIDEALEQSRYLIAICSPKSAVSQWVNQEIVKYKSQDRADRVLCLIVDGEPNASDSPGSGLLECFPEAIRYRVRSDREITEKREEPIAADVRPQGDGKRNAKLKILAGMLDVDYDELKQRDRKRRFWRRLQMAVAAMCLLFFIALIWYNGHLQARENAKKRSNQLANTMIQQTRGAMAAREYGVATLYGAHAIRYRLLAEENPIEVDLLSSLSPPAILTRTVSQADFSGGIGFSVDGTMFVSGGHDGLVRIWKMPECRLLRSLKGHAGPVLTAVFSPNGRLLASAGMDKTIRVWDLKTWQPIRVLKGHDGPVTSIAFSPDSMRMVSGSRDHTIRLWNLESGEMIQTYRGHVSDVNSVDFSPDGSLIASGSKDNSLRLWSIKNNEPPAVLATYGQPVMCVTFSPEGGLLAAGVRDGSAKLWDFNIRKELASLGKHRLAVFGVAFSPDGELLAVASRDRSIKLWELDTLQELATLKGHKREVKAVSFQPQGQTLVSGSADGVLKIWHVAAREDFKTLPGHTAPVRGVDFSPDGKMMVSCGDDNLIKLWDTATYSEIRTLKGHRDSVRSVKFSPNGDFIASASRDNTLRLWETRTGKQISWVKAHDDYVVDLDYSPDGRFIATAGWDHLVKIWELPSLHEAGVLEGHAGEVSAVRFSPDGSRIATASYDSTVKVWDAVSGKELVTLHGHDKHVRTLAFSPDGKTLATGGWDRLIRLWDMDTYSLAGTLLSHHSFEVWYIAFSPDGRLLASATPSQDRRTIRLFDMERGRLVDWLSGHDQYALALDFHPQGHILASGGTDNVLRLWRISDFWPQLKAKVSNDPGALLRTYLDHPPYEMEGIDRIIDKIEELTGFELIGTIAMPKTVD